MLLHRYRIWNGAWGDDLDPDHPNERRLVGVVGRAKRDREAPFETFNELVAMQLGQMLGLPIPVGLLVKKDEHDYFVSFDVAAAGEVLPPADLSRFCSEHRYEACGVMLFDAWIANPDRHAENLWFDYYSMPPKIVAFDHGRGVLGTGGKVHLSSNEDRLNVHSSVDGLARHISSFQHFPDWYDRLLKIPAATILRTTEQAADLINDPVLARECGDWLIARRDRLPELFRNERHVFPKLEQTVFDPFGESDDYFPEYCI